MAWHTFHDGLDRAPGRKVENVECLEVTVNYSVLQLYLWTEMFIH